MSGRVIAITIPLAVVLCCWVVPACRKPDDNKAAKPAPLSARTEAEMPATATEAHTTAEPTGSQTDSKQDAPGASVSESDSPVVAIADAEKTTTDAAKEAGGAPSGDSMDDGEAVAPADIDRAATPGPKLTPLDELADRMTEEEYAAIQERIHRKKTPDKPKGHDPLDTTEREIIEQWDKVQGLSATVTIITEVGPPGNRAVSTTRGTYDLQKTGKDTKVRLDVATENETEKEDSTSIQTSQNQFLIDGEYAYSLTEKDGEIRGSKMLPSIKHFFLFGGRPLFMQLHKEHSLKLLLPETLDGRPTHVIGLTKEGLDGTTKYYFDKETGVLLKMVGPSTEDGSFVTTYTDIEIDPTFPEGHFVFQEPPGVRMMDLTKSKMMAPVQ